MTKSLVVLAFETMDEADKVHEALVKGMKAGLLQIEDAAVVVKDEEGKVNVKNQVARGTWISTGVGGALGLLIGGIFFPLGGLVMGLAGGALVGRMMDLGVDSSFVKDIEQEIKPGTSALFVLISNADPAGALALLRPFSGKVLQTNLSTQAEEGLRRALATTRRCAKRNARRTGVRTGHRRANPKSRRQESLSLGVLTS
jgi:uncharacterized membrane protein